MTDPGAATLSKGEIRRGLRIATWDGVAGNVHNVLVGNVFLTGFALAWGANDFQLGLLGAIPFLGALGQMAGAFLVDRWPGRRREIVMLLGLISRSSWFAIAAIPFLFHSSPQAAMAWISLLFLLYQIIYSASGPGWVAWMAVLVPERVRGRYLGIRCRATEAVGMITAITAGLAIDGFRAAHWERGGFAVLQSVAASMGIAGFLLLRRQPDPGYHAVAPELSLDYLFRPLRDARFRSLVIFNVSWCFGLNVATPFLNAHLLNNMHWDFKRLATLGVLASIAAILMNPVWGRMADRIGYKHVLRLSWIGMLLVPVCYACCPWQMQWPIYLANIVSGVSLSGFTLAIFGITLDSLPKQARAMGAATLHAAAGPTTFISGALSGWLAQLLAHAHWHSTVLPLTNYQILFLLSVILRIPTILLLRRIQEPNAMTRMRKPVSTASPV